MGQSTAETLKEIDVAREKLESDLHELSERLPHPSERTKRIASITFAGAAVAWVMLKIVRKRGAR